MTYRELLEKPNTLTPAQLAESVFGMGFASKPRFVPKRENRTKPDSKSECESEQS